MDHIDAAGIAEWIRINGGEWMNVEFTCDGNRLGYRQPGVGPPTWISVQQITNVDALSETDLAVVDIEVRITDGRLIGAHIRKPTLDAILGALTAPRVPVFPATSATSPQPQNKPTQPSGPGSAADTVRIRPGRQRVWIATAIVLLLAGGLAAVLVVVSNDKSSTETSSAEASDDSSPIEAAAESCGVQANVGDNGYSIEFDTEGEDDLSGDEVEDVACVLKALDAPDRVISRIDSTRALDGTLDAAWGQYESFWNYHPDSGMNLTIYVPE